jgi:tetratricopeptide (TPR) repeat protein
MSRASSRSTYAAFISHAKSDEKTAKEIAAGLEVRNFKCWIAPRDVRPGHAYGDEIVRGIEKSRAFILVLSKASNSSAFVAREVERAVSKGKAVYAIRVENVQPSPSLELFISGTQWIDAWSGGLSQHIDGLAGLLRKKKGAQPATPVAEQEPQPAPVARRRPAWLLGGGALAAAAVAVTVFVLGPFKDIIGGPAGSRADDPDFQACEKMSGDAAIAFCDRAIASGKFSGKELARTHLNRGYERRQKNDTDGALSDYGAAIAANPEYALAYYNRGNVYRSLGKSDLALTDLNEAIRLNAADPDAYNWRGVVYKDSSDFENALKDFSEALRLDPNRIPALSNRGELYRQIGNDDLAIADYKKVLSLNPDDETRKRVVAALSALGVSTADKTDDPDYQGCEKLSGAAAMAACDRAIESEAFGGSELSELYRLRGWERRQSNDLEGGMADYDKAIQVDPKNLNAYYHRGAAYVSENKLDAAIQDFDKAIGLKPNYANAIWRRGKAYQAKGDLEKAKQDYEKALALGPEDSVRQEIETALKSLEEQSAPVSQSSAAQQ